MSVAELRPPVGLGGPHAQTMLSSTLRKALVRNAASAFHAVAEREVLTTPAGVQLEVWHNRHEEPDRPAVFILHGWLGSASSGYTLSAAMRLKDAGFNTVRINLRDHGDTAHLNRELFNSARLDEAVDLVRMLRGEYSSSGLLGFSLGGNFALRIARSTGIPTLAVCPAMDPALTMQRIDGGSPVYRYYFVNKWLRALRAKQAAFPDAYNFDEALQLRSVRTLTDLFVIRHSEFRDTEDYFDRYDLTGDALDGTTATILAALDDPVIPPQQFDRLPKSVTVHLTQRGGHCGFLKNWRMDSASDDYAVNFFSERLI